ncbi:MAG: NAD(P)H-dependent oxidoreductase [Rickettsiales bacterium]
MPAPLRLLFMCGSMRKASFNKKLATEACRMAKERGADARFIDLPSYDIPIYNDDVVAETGVPKDVERLKSDFMQAHGVFIASPEYNGSYSGALKNAFDWISRKSIAEEKDCVAFDGRPFALVSASPGAGGGLRGLIALRDLLGKMRAHILPNQLAVGRASSIFSEDGNISDDATKEKMRLLTTEFIEFALRLRSRP